MTWNTDTVTGQVLLPHGLQIRPGVKKHSADRTDAILPTALIGRMAPGEETAIPGPHSYGGAYTELRFTSRGVATFREPRGRAQRTNRIVE